jgi:hypothetical protein
MFRGKLLITVAAASLMSFVAVSAGAADKFLADRHVERGQKCDACHTQDNKIKQSGDYDICVACHGDYNAMIARTASKYQGKVNPHAQHEGILPCVECHKGHQKSVNYCGGCHSYIYEVP